MPINKYYGGHGREVMANMVSEYGAKQAKQVFYATENKRKSAKVGAKASGAGATGGTQRITEDDPRWNPRTMGNRRGVKHSRNASDGHGQYRPT